jgi:hypothetical protein
MNYQSEQFFQLLIWTQKQLITGRKIRYLTPILHLSVPYISDMCMICVLYVKIPDMYLICI